jgi:hypothetical protein
MSFPNSKVPTGVSEWNWGNGPFPNIADFAYVVGLSSSKHSLLRD